MEVIKTNRIVVFMASSNVRLIKYDRAISESCHMRYCSATTLLQA